MSAIGWDLLTAQLRPVPADVAGALADLGLDVVREVSRGGSSELLVHCPAHERRTGHADRKASLWINDTSGGFLCFSCGHTGGFIDLVTDARAVGHAEALSWIAARGLYRLPDDPPAPPAAEDAGHGLAVTEASLALYTPPPPRALAARRLTAAACARYGVLWNPTTRRWILPIRDPVTGVLRGWQEKGGRRFLNHPDGVKKSHALFGSGELPTPVAVLVESPLDAVRLASLGIPGAVAAYGAYVSDAQMRHLARTCAHLILGLDNDAAGRSGRDGLYTRWRPRGLTMSYLDYSHTSAKDVGDMSDDEARAAVDGAHLPFARRA